MEITDVSVEERRPVRIVGRRTAVKERARSTCLLVEIEADVGATGIGEIPDVEQPDALPPLSDIEAELERCLRGEDPRQIRRLARDLPGTLDLEEGSFHSFRQLTLGAIDAALYDLVGNHHELPAHQLLGGTVGDVPICWVVFTRPGDDPLDDLEAEVEEKYDAGFRAFKLKVGEREPAVDAERIRTVREVVGDDADVFVDAQGVWTLEEAIENVRRFAEIGIDGVETPVGHPDPTVDAPGYYYDTPLLPSELAELRRRTAVPVMEHVLDPAFGLELARADAVDVFTVGAYAGGITPTREILAIANGAGLDARLGSTVELGPGTLAAATLAATSPAVTAPSDLIGPLVYEEDVVEPAVTYTDGALAPRDRPGLGFELRR